MNMFAFYGGFWAALGLFAIGLSINIQAKSFGWSVFFLLFGSAILGMSALYFAEAFAR